MISRSVRDKLGPDWLGENRFAGGGPRRKDDDEACDECEKWKVHGPVGYAP
jgi:hypothetical protein